MKSDLFIRNLLIIIVILLALNIILPILSNPPTSYAAKNIEYKVLWSQDISCGAEEEYFFHCMEKTFNEYAKEGWEYIDNVAGTYYLFKR